MLCGFGGMYEKINIRILAKVAGKVLEKPSHPGYAPFALTLNKNLFHLSLPPSP